MYGEHLIGTHVEIRSLEELVAVKMPKLAAHLTSLGCDLTIVATDWFLCLFCTQLPSQVRPSRHGNEDLMLATK
jgi:TBC1 domain family member 2A